MNLADNYKLIYTYQATPQHILQRAKTNIIAKALDTARNARMAEYLLQALDFDKTIQDRYSSLTVGQESINALRLRDDITHIHAAKADEIKERFAVPAMTDEEFERALFEDQIQPEIDKAFQKTGGNIVVRA